MLGNTEAVQKYFEKSAAQLRPMVSAEWNYNLLYQPYVTYSGSGENLYKNDDNWEVSSNITQSTNQNGKIASAFNNPRVRRFTVRATNTTSDSSFQGKANITLKDLPIGANSYKIIFYVRSTDSNVIGLSSYAFNLAAKVSGSSYKTIDNFDWQKIELVVGAKSGDALAQYKDLSLNLEFVNTTLNKIGTWGIEVCNIEIYQITYFDYLYGNLWPTESAFTYFRPGESYVNSGNINIPDPVRKINRFNTTWDKTMPCSPVVYSPRTLFSANSNPLYKNGNLSIYSQYKYFVSERPNGKAVSIGASYENLMDVNKIVLKFNVSQSIPNGNLVLYNGNLPVANISISSDQISRSGICILYYHPEAATAAGKWTTTKWAWSENDTSKMPQINKKGEITVSQKINKIVFTQSNVTPLSGYQLANYNKSSKTDVLAEFERLQVIEMSPRLELDLSTFVLEYTVTKELDNKGTPLPISAMSANSAQISLSNIPLSGEGNIPLSVFSTNANNATLFISPLKNLLVKNVKFYVNYYIPQARINEQTTANRIIPGGVFYADTWDSFDIKVTKISCYDTIKFLQTVPVSDYVSQSQSMVNIFTNIMDFAGFTDYDYDGLYAALTDSNQTLNTSYFFADSKSKTVYDILKEAFLAYQIGASVDEYGILRFVNLQKIITSNRIDYTVNDDNIVVNSYSENIKTKIGKILMRYRMPQVKKNITELSNSKDIVSVFQQAPSPIWEEKTEDVVPYNYITQDIASGVQNYYTINKQDLNELFYTMPLDHNGYGIIEGEIISTGDKEVLFTDLNNTSNFATYPVNNANELNSALAEFSNNYKTANVMQKFTGRFLNVERGLFGTIPTPHKIMDTSADFGARLQYATVDTSRLLAGLAFVNYLAVQNDLTIEPLNGAINVPISNNKFSLVFPKTETDIGYKSYSVKFKLPDITTTVEGGLFFNLTTSNSQNVTSSYYQIGIQSEMGTDKKKAYKLNISEVNPSGGKTIILTRSITDIMNAILNNEPKSPSFTNRQSMFINLRFVWQSNKTIIYINDYRLETTKLTNTKGSVGSRFGFYTYSPSTVTTQSWLAEIYACESILDDTPRYHFITQRYLDAIVMGKKLQEKFFLVQSTPQIIGLNIYDVQNEFTPSLGAEPLKIQYNLYYNKIGSTSVQSQYMTIPDSALSYSTIINSGYRSKLAVANNSTYSVFTKTSSSYSKKVNSTFALFSRTPIVLTEQQTAERILNPQNSNEVIELQSDWLQSKRVANSIMGVVARASDDFSKDISVSLFGNPLIEVGDVLDLTHDLKNIKGLKFFVQSVTNTFRQGLTTDIVLNQITYTGSETQSLKKQYPQLNAKEYLNILTIEPNFGSTAGDTLVTISNGVGFTSPPIVYFDNSQATNVTVVNSTTITCRTPPHDPGFVNVRVVYGGKTYYTINYDSFEYRGTDVVLDPITQVFEVSNGQNATTGKYEVALDWIDTDNRSNAFKWTLSNGTSGLISYYDTSPLYKILFENLDSNKTYTGTITTFYILNGAEIGKSTPFNFTFTTGTNNNPDPNGTPVISATAIKDASNNVTFTIKVTENVADAFYWRIFNGTGDNPYVTYQQPSGIWTADYKTYKFTNDWFISMYAKNGSLVSNTVTIYYRNISLSDEFQDPNGPTAVPAAPTINGISSLTEGNNKSTFQIRIAQDNSANKPTSYTFTVTPSRYLPAISDKMVFPSSQFGIPVNGEYVFSLNGYTNGTNYKIDVFGSNSKGNSNSTSTSFKVDAAGYKVSNVTLSNNLIASWTSDPYFDSYSLTYYTETGAVLASPPNIIKTQAYVGSSLLSVWKRSTGNNISVGGTSFTDDYYSGQTKFAGGLKIYLQVTPIRNGVSGTPAKSNVYTIPGTNPTGVAPKIIPENFHRSIPSGTRQSPRPGGNFHWIPGTIKPSGTYTGWQWEWELYRNRTSATGGRSDFGTFESSSPNIPSLKMFYADTGNFVGTHYFQARMKIFIGPLIVYGPWGGAKGTFT